MSTDHEAEELAKEIASNCLAVRLRAITRMITNLFAREFRGQEMTISQFHLIIAIQRNGSVRPGELAEKLKYDPSTLSRNLERMKAKGWIETIAEPDARAAPVQLTATGKAELKKSYAAWKRAQSQTEELLGPLGSAAIKETYSKVISLSIPDAD
ncbi:Multiple antibiotic resistance protein MarR [Planctomycetales bacterium 10988]|nr:Multiple antibiotic resistance protein MarR [Planctomycetales bacterium 10988]